MKQAGVAGETAPQPEGAEELAAARRQIAELSARLERERAARAEAEGQLRDAQRSGQDLVSHLSEVICVLDPEGVIGYVSPAVEAFLGYTPDEVAGRPYRHFVHPDDLARLDANVRAALEGRPVANEYRLLTRSGEVRWVQTASRPLMRDGEVLGVQGALTDVTALKEGEERLRRQNQFLTDLLEALPHPFYVVNAHDYSVELANSAARMGAAVGRQTCYALTHGRREPCSPAEHPCPLDQVLATGRPATAEHLHTQPGGGQSWVEVHAYPVRDASGEVVQVIEYALDITERRRAEQAQQQARAAEERTRLARELHDSVSQALFSANLVAEMLPQAWRRDPDEGLRGLEELRALTRSALAEMRAMLLELRPSALAEGRLDPLLRQLVEVTASRAGLVAEVQVDPLPELPAEVRVAFYRVAQEALHNVAKHACAGRVWLELRAGPPATPGSTGGSAGRPGAPGDGRPLPLRLSVRDDGIGFDPQRVGPGHLGLGILRERAAAIGAELAVDAAPGRGTQVVLAWPASDRRESLWDDRRESQPAGGVPDERP